MGFRENEYDEKLPIVLESIQEIKIMNEDTIKGYLEEIVSSQIDSVKFCKLFYNICESPEYYRRINCKDDLSGEDINKIKVLAYLLHKRKINVLLSLPLI